MESLTNKTFGPYQIVGEVGRGGMAIVYKAYQSKLDRYVAIKVLPPQFTFDPEFVKRFELEAKAAAKLKHPNIVTIFDVGEQDGFHYIAMEFVEGVSLADLIRREGPLPPKRVANIISQIASALDYAHALGYIHRDVKPSNIMVGAGDQATLTDFGIVKAAEGTRVTKSGMMMGTPEYMAPEQIRGEPIDARADVYALGIVCYEMLAGRAPFQGDTARVLYGQVNEQPPSMRALNPRVPLAVEQAMGGALAKDPRQRYASAGDFANALNAAAGATAPASNAPSPRMPEAPTRYGAMPSRKQTPAMLPIVAGVVGGIVFLIAIAAIAIAANNGNKQVVVLSPITMRTSAPMSAPPSASTNGPIVKPIDTPETIVVMATPIPPTNTPTLTTIPPSPTSNPTSTPTSNPTRTPTTTPVGSGLLAIKRVIRSTSFDNPALDPFRTWGSNATVKSGIVRLVGIQTLGKQQNSFLSANFLPEPDSATIIRFKKEKTYSGGISLTFGNWGTTAFCSFSLDFYVSNFQWSIYTGDLSGPSDSTPQFYSPIPMPQDNAWYYVMLRIRPQGLVEGILWKADDLSNLFKFSHEVSQDWVNHTFYFQAGVNEGTMDIDEFQEVELAE